MKKNSMKKADVADMETPKVLGAYIERVRSMHLNSKNIPDGYFCILHESSNLLIYVETILKIPVERENLLDDNIDFHWSNYRNGKEWADDRAQSVSFSYKLCNGQEVLTSCYRWQELEHFRLWLELQYKQNYLPEYLANMEKNQVA